MKVYGIYYDMGYGCNDILDQVYSSYEKALEKCYELNKKEAEIHKVSIEELLKNYDCFSIQDFELV